jgi:hypothetical protein
METHIGLSAVHWVYLCGVVAIVVAMVSRANVVAPAMLATFSTIYAFSGSIPTAIESVFFASLTAARELFTIFLVIALMTALLNALRKINADIRMVKPFKALMVNGHIELTPRSWTV